MGLSLLYIVNRLRRIPWDGRLQETGKRIMSGAEMKAQV